MDYKFVPGTKNRKPKYLSVTEAARYISIQKHQLETLEKQGKIIPKINPINYHRMYDIEQLKELAKEIKDLK